MRIDHWPPMFALALALKSVLPTGTYLLDRGTALWHLIRPICSMGYNAFDKHFD